MAIKLLITLPAHQKKSPKEFHSKELHSKELPSNEANNEITKERYISQQERQQTIDELRLIY